MNYKKIVSIILISTGIGSLSLLFINATNSEINRLVVSSKNFTTLMNKNGRTRKAKDILSAHKRRIANLIAVKTEAGTCGELLSVDSSLISGFYKLYPVALNKPVVYYCEVNAGKIKKAQKIASIDVSADCLNNNTCVNSRDLLSTDIVLKGNADFKRHDIGAAEGTSWSVKNKGGSGHSGKVLATGSSLELSPSHYIATFRFKTGLVQFKKNKEGNYMPGSAKPSSKVFDVSIYDQISGKTLEHFFLDAGDSNSLQGKILLSVGFSNKGLQDHPIGITVREFGTANVSFEEAIISANYPLIYAEMAAAIEKEKMRKTALEGKVERFAVTENQTHIEGFACLPGFDVHPKIKVYIGSGSKRKLAAQGTTTEKSGDAVNTACKNTHKKHKFFIPVSADDLDAFYNDVVTVEADHPAKNETQKLNGTLSVMNYYQTIAKPKGAIWVQQRGHFSARVHGWTCIWTLKEPLQVGVTIGGKTVFSGVSNRNTDNKCGTPNFKAYGFEVDVSRRALGGRSVTATAVHPVTKQNFTVPGSGAVVPRVTWEPGGHK